MQGAGKPNLPTAPALHFIGNRDAGQFGGCQGFFTSAPFGVLHYSEIKPGMAAESRGTRKKKSRSKDGFAPEEVVLPPAREQTMPEEVI